MRSKGYDMVPPWERFPTYTRFTIGWRMGAGEDYIGKWYAFIEKLPIDFDSRLKYLGSHRPAPVNWADTVCSVLYPGAKPGDNYNRGRSEIPRLLDLGLIEYDAAYHTWIKGQSEIKWPWLWAGTKTPQEAARYRTRELWFFSRQIDAARRLSGLVPDKVPFRWKSVKKQILNGNPGDVNPKKGLLTMAQMLCAGSVRPPWDLGLSLDDVSGSFEMNMGYSDAFCLWITTAFDDDILLRKIFDKGGIPSEWESWFNEQAEFY